MKAKIVQAVKAVWKNEWQHNIGTKWNHRQTKDWFPEPNNRRSFLLVRNNDRIMLRPGSSTIVFLIDRIFNLTHRIFNLMPIVF